VKQLAQTALKSKKYARLLYRLVKHYQPQTIIELGTSLGITSSYLSAANPRARVISIEGSASVAETAQENFQQLGLRNIELINGNFDDILPDLLKNLDQIDVGYVDGNHRYEPTIRYFLQFLHKSHNDTILIFDDIHWSAEMERAWEEIKAHPSVRYTIDLFFLGFAFFREEFKVKQNFTIRY
jgi:predicted O-methyltransferase YrrM